MNKTKITAGIITMAVGLLMIIGSSVDAIIDSSSTLYIEKQAFDVSFKENDVTIPYLHPDKKKISFWKNKYCIWVIFLQNLVSR